MTSEHETPGNESDENAISGEDNVAVLQTEAELGALRVENAELKDRVLRVVAEMENLRKRTVREVSDARTYAIADFARDMLSATDNLERALVTLPDELRQVTDPAVKSLIEGIEMTEREMQRLMKKNGVRPIPSEGHKFDPHKHQAMFEVPNENVPAGTVVQVVQTGFEIGDRVLRPAMVGISKGGPKQGAPGEHGNISSIDIAVNPEHERPEDFDEDPEGDETGLHIDREV